MIESTKDFVRRMATAKRILELELVQASREEA